MYVDMSIIYVITDKYWCPIVLIILQNTEVAVDTCSVHIYIHAYAGR